MSEKIFVTGGSGFLGSKIINYLKKQGVDFVNYDLLEPKEFNENYIQGDILDKDYLFKSMEGCDRVIHCAASLPLNKYDNNYDKVNVIGTKNIVEASNTLHVKHFLHISSSAVLGKDHNGLIKEKSERDPFDPYGKSKSIAEEEVEKNLDKRIKLSIIRPRTIVGISRVGIFGILYDFTRNNLPIFIIGNGKNMLQLIDGDEIATAISMASIQQVSGVYNLGNNDMGKLGDLYEDFVNKTNSKSRIVKLPATLAIFLLSILDKLHLSPLAPWHYKSFHVDFAFESSELYKIIGYYPTKSNLSILLENYNEYIEKETVGSNLSTHQSKIPLKLLNIFKLFGRK